MMNQFRAAYYPGGMSLDRSSWWLVLDSYDSRQGVVWTKLRKLAEFV